MTTPLHVHAQIELIQVCALDRAHPLYFHYALRVQCVDVRNDRWRVTSPRERFRLPDEDDRSYELSSAYERLVSTYDEVEPVVLDYDDAWQDASQLAPYALWGEETAADVVAVTEKGAAP